MKLPLPEIRSGRVLVDGVAASLRQAILDGDFAPGEKLDQDLIAKELRVSRTPIREALRKLESEGFVEVRPHFGAYVANVSPDDIREVYEIRTMLEAEIVRQATSLIPKSVLDEIETCLRQTQSELEAGDISRSYDTDIYFHNSLLDYVENQLLKEVLTGLNNRIMRVRLFALRQPGPHVIESHREHRAILDAMRQRDPKRAAGLMADHLRSSGQRIQALSQM